MREAIQGILEAEAQAKQAVRDAEAQSRERVARAREVARSAGEEAARSVRLESQALIATEMDRTQMLRRALLETEHRRIAESFDFAVGVRQHAVEECLRVILGLP